MSEAIALVCKTCGREFLMPEGVALWPCPGCGTNHSRPRAADKALADLRRAHQQRCDCDFVSAAANYQRVLNVHPDEAEALWGLALCKYGVEFVQDEKTGRHLPVIHFLNRRPFTEDPDVRMAIVRADAVIRSRYQQDAEYIARIQQEVLRTEARGEAYDVFLCYKASVPGQPDAHTREFTHAQDLYIALRDMGCRVFFAHTTLRRAAGANYEAQIFHALQSAKAMLVVTSDPACLNTPWVHSEWARYLERIDAGEPCRLIPLLYDGCDPYALPDAFLRRSIQGLRMDSLTALDDLRGILEGCIAPKQTAQPEAAAVPQPVSPATEPLLRRAFLFLEDGDWQSADAYCEKVLDADPECARAYVGKLMAALHVTQQGKLPDMDNPFDGDPNYRKALRFADAALKKELQDANAHIRERNENAAKDAAYRKAEQALAAAKTEQDFLNAKKQFEALGGWKDAATKAMDCETARKDFLYRRAENALAATKTEQDFINAKQQFEALGGWKDAAERAMGCETARKDFLYRRAENTLAAAKTEQDFINAKQQFEALGGWKDAAKQAQLCAEKAEATRKNDIYDKALRSMTHTPTEETLTEAIRIFQTIPGWRDADQRVETCKQKIAELKAKAAAEEAARIAAKKAARQRKRRIGIGTAVLAAVVAVVLLVTNVFIPIMKYGEAEELLAAGNTTAAAMAFGRAGWYRDGMERSTALWDGIAVRNTIAAGGYHTVGLRADGTVVAVGKNGDGRCNTSAWSDIVAIAAGYSHTVGLRADGSVVAVGKNGDGRCNTSAWSDIVAIAAGYSHTVGLRADGTVVAVGNNTYGQCKTSAWSDIVAIAVGDYHTVGLRADGTVVAVGRNDDGQCNTSAWSDIVAIAAGYYHTVGLRADGTVVAVGDNDYGQCDTSTWRLKTVPRPTLPE